MPRSPSRSTHTSKDDAVLDPLMECVQPREARLLEVVMNESGTLLTADWPAQMESVSSLAQIMSGTRL